MAMFCPPEVIAKTAKDHFSKIKPAIIGAKVPKIAAREKIIPNYTTQHEEEKKKGPPV